MATVSLADSKRMYSWWWNSHISPKNSRWLQENLSDMDVKVKQMIKLIEEDADSFARRAEMYYKKRPELMKLVEEFYRAYRALAERYDNATGVLRQAHRTMAEAFPNQVPVVLTDDSSVVSADGEPRTPDMPPIRALFDPDELQKDALGISPSHSHAIKRHIAFTEESDSVPGRKGLKQLNDLFGTGEGRARKGLNFHDAEEKDQVMQNIGKSDIKALVPSESERVGKAELEIVTLKNAIAKLEAEKEAGLLQYQQSLDRLSKLESEVSCAKEDSKGLNERASKAEAEVQTLKEALTKLDAEREASFLQYQQCLDKITNLENNISHAQKDAGELNERATKAEIEVQSLMRELAKLKAEKEDTFLQFKQCLEKISDLEGKLLHAEEDSRRYNEHADKAEREVETLKEVLAKLTEEKEAAAVQYQQCLDTISSLEQKLTFAQEEAKRLNSDIDDGIVKLKGAEEKCLLLERSNQTMHTELESQAQIMASQSEELTEKQKELGRLWTCIQEERLRFMEAETAFQTLQHLHSQSQEELRSMAAELQTRAQILQDLEAHNHSLQNEVEQAKVENKGLTEVNLSSALTIQNLQGEISSLRDTIGKLEADVELRLDQRNALQQEIYCLKEELNDVNKKHQGIMDQVESVGFSPECLGSSVKGLQDENIKIKEVCEKERSQNVALLEKLEIMEKLIEKNALLENSLSDLNVELEGVRERVWALEESCQTLLEEKSTLVSEKAALVSRLQIATDNLEKLTEKNNILENSLFDANAEVEGLRVKSKSLEELCMLLDNEKSDLATVKENLISQLGITQERLEDLEKNYRELQQKYLTSAKERESALHEVEELHVQLNAQKQEYASHAQLSESRLAGMATQIHLLQEEGHCIKKEHKEELDKAFYAQTEIFILQKCAQDLEENNLSLFLECQKLLEASKLSEKLISELEHENLEQQVEVKSLYDQIEVLRVGLYRVLKALELEAKQGCEDKAEQDQMLLNHALDKLQETQNFLFEMQDQNQQLVIENTVLVTLLGQLRQEVANLVTAKNTLDQELASRSEQFLLLHGENQNFAEVNEELRSKIMERDCKEENLTVELKTLHGQLLDLQGDYQNLRKEKCKVVDEQRLLMKSISDLGEEKCNLEEENCAIFAETVSLSTISLIFRDIIVEKFLDIKELSENLDTLHDVNNGLNEKVKMMEGKLLELSVIQDEKRELHKMVEDLKCKYDEVELIRADQEKQIIKLSGDSDQQCKAVECIQEANQELETELGKLNTELLETKIREESLNCELQKGRIEIEWWESQGSALFGELQISAVQQALFEGKVHELIEASESLEGRNRLNDREIDQMKERVSTLELENEELKSQMTSHVPAFTSLRDCVASLENHTLSHATLHGIHNKEAKDATFVVHTESCQQISDDQTAMGPGGLLDLQDLQMRIIAIEEAVKERERLVILENSNANSKLADAIRQIEEMKSESSLHGEAVEAGKHGNQNPDDKELGSDPDNNLRLQKRTHENAEEGNGVMTKDIMLDQISECSSYGISRRETVEADDQMLEIWETTTDQDASIDLTVGKARKATATLTEKKRNKDHPSVESMVEKDVSVDKLEISKRLSGSRQEVNERKILERLDSDAQKLTNLQITVQDLKRKVEITEKNKGKGIEYDNVKEQLEESEEAIIKLFDVNRKLMKSIEDESFSVDEKSVLALDENGSVRKRRISEQARRGSEKIGRLQLEVQKLQFLLLKLDDANKSRGKTKIIERKTRVLLRDYLYGGTRTSQKRKKGHFCACMQPPTKGD
ncbi:hypothetical protein P3X46_003487 [Hevea brasiliensis]|uniref:NAB domain-containing protein n=1 Tax=Hevea brasiliensis TaxID=3981 RepID=A0ABQ9NB78_HEVBR|nr:protein NETWORKED 1D [Hevea brasiliensis]XP_021680529.2 protein NETWORKED 1D [Hevea brasiliensis]KAJ9188094.1 hypothetical protein P3X46_003487 [Hevea brasiliensis]